MGWEGNIQLRGEYNVAIDDSIYLIVPVKYCVKKVRFLCQNCNCCLEWKNYY